MTDSNFSYVATQSIPGLVNNSELDAFECRTGRLSDRVFLPDWFRARGRENIKSFFLLLGERYLRSEGRVRGVHACRAVIARAVARFVNRVEFCNRVVGKWIKLLAEQGYIERVNTVRGSYLQFIFTSKTTAIWDRCLPKPKPTAKRDDSARRPAHKGYERKASIGEKEGNDSTAFNSSFFLKKGRASKSSANTKVDHDYKGSSGLKEPTGNEGRKRGTGEGHTVRRAWRRVTSRFSARGRIEEAIPGLRIAVSSKYEENPALKKALLDFLDNSSDWLSDSTTRAAMLYVANTWLKYRKQNASLDYFEFCSRYVREAYEAHYRRIGRSPAQRQRRTASEPRSTHGAAHTSASVSPARIAEPSPPVDRDTALSGVVDPALRACLARLCGAAG